MKQHEYDRICLGVSLGFGHTISIPIAASTFNKKILIVFFQERSRYNLELENILEIPHVTFLRFSFYTTHDIARKIIISLAKWTFSKRFGVKDFYYAYDNVSYKSSSANNFYKNFVDIHGINPSAIAPDYNFWMPAYMSIVDNHKIKYNISSSDKLTDDLNIENSIALYVRHKDQGEISKERNAGDKEVYINVIQNLTRKGYTIFLLGECMEIANALKQNQRVKNRKLYRDKNLYDLVVPLRCTYFVGNAGGGTMIRALSKKSALIIEVFPFHWANPNSYILFKRVKFGDVVMGVKEFRESEYDWYKMQYTNQIIPLNNTAEEIKSAVNFYILDNDKSLKSTNSVGLWSDYGRSFEISN